MLESIMGWFRSATPTPTKHGLQVQLGVHFEEVAEMLDTIDGDTADADSLVVAAVDSLRALSNALKQGRIGVHITDRTEFADAMADQVVTTMGCCHQAHIDGPLAVELANTSNYSKFVDGAAMFDANGKITKGPDYQRADFSQAVL